MEVDKSPVPLRKAPLGTFEEIEVGAAPLLTVGAAGSPFRESQTLRQSAPDLVGTHTFGRYASFVDKKCYCVPRKRIASREGAHANIRHGHFEDI
jgi:hypothetical protein